MYVPCSPDRIAAALGLVLVSEHELSGFRPNTVCSNYHVGNNPLTTLEYDSGLVFSFEILGDVFAKADGDPQLIPRMVEDHLVQLPPVAVEYRCLFI